MPPRPSTQTADSEYINPIIFLPELCQHKIYKMLHKMYMIDLCREIEHNVTWVRLRSGNNYRYQFLTSIQKNFTVW